MLLVGVCNPTGEADTYNGLYMTQAELARVVSDSKMRGIPVKTEHSGSEVGRVLTSFLDADGKLNCVMELSKSSLPACLAQGFVRDGLALDLSLGYTVDIQNTDNNLQAIEKKIVEVSLVRKGARKGCHITAYQDEGRDVVFKGQDAWVTFDMS
jgi:hypothetical protein